MGITNPHGADMPFTPKEFPVQRVLELACAAQRINGDYVKESEAIYTSDGVFVGIKASNRELVDLTLEVKKWQGEQRDHPALLKITKDDQELAAEIQKYFRKLIFSVIEGASDFITNVNSALQSDNIKSNQFGYICCLPQVYKQDYAKTQFKKRLKDLESGYVGPLGQLILDKDCEIIESSKSKNFDAWNVYAIIDNKMVSWMSKSDLKLGACVLIKAKIKEYNNHWKYGNPITRLNYVKAFQ